ncbi:MAG: 2-oxoglutarate dehydrogenase E1 component [Saprospirales bacterium]|nr:2-oxoglutarate dehydrogenase E1 component [Saprospirales bacterium]
MELSYLNNTNPAFLESMYNDYVQDPDGIDQEYRKFFDGFHFALASGKDGSTSQVLSSKEFNVMSMIHAYRNNGHLEANTNPIRPRKERKAFLQLEDHGLSKKDLTTTFACGSVIGLGPATLEKIIEHLRQGYCQTLGYQYNYIRNTEEREWFRHKIEGGPHFVDYTLEKKEHILRMLNKATIFEKFLGTKYIGEKRFSLEGGETAIPALESIVEQAAKEGVEEVIIGMAHRGRLNVLTNLMGKTYDEIFSEFEGFEPEKTFGDGDVKYHLGFSSLFTTKSGKKVNLKLSPNPSHLEAVDPVVEGFARAKADTVYNSNYDKILPILIHGDAAVAGQGVVYEVLQMSKLDGYYTGGTIHYVINNQIGFTTDFDDARSSDYCTSIARTVDAPIIQVNGDDIEAVVFASELAAQYRQRFNKDIFIDMVCYRKHGHNESDDPKYTQPDLYQRIAKHANPRDIYSKKLQERGEIEAEVARRLDKEFWDDLQARLDQVKENKVEYAKQEVEKAWDKTRSSKPEDFQSSPKTGISKSTVKTLVSALSTHPEGFKPLRKVDKYLKNRQKTMHDDKTVDWAAAELLAYGSILMDGKDVRMSGQDVKRGTFSHRHAVIMDEKTNTPFNRLSKISGKQGRFMIYNSHLSEYGVLGFEYGYSLANPNTLTIWEAQFGDFANNAQSVFDQFISAGESKWNRNSGMMMLLPHGYEGQGPEHSSARLERHLQSCAEENMVVANVTEASNFFHLIRRQLAWPFRKPLVVMSPKSLLRHPRVSRPIGEILEGGFQEVLDDREAKATKVKRVLLCSGKFSYDLMEARDKQKIDHVAIVRLEQLYPLATKQLDRLKKKYANAEWMWAQEEPRNMGAWAFIQDNLGDTFNLDVIARKRSASPSTGYKKQHLLEQNELIQTALTL